MENILNEKLFAHRENNRKHISYDLEMGFYELIKNGDVDGVKHRLDLHKMGEYDDFGILSEDPVRNLRYHFIIMSALVTRICTEGGLEYASAYNLSEIYIQKVDKCNSIEQIEKIMYEMIFDYTNRMRASKKMNIFSKKVVLAIDYIFDNLHSKITLEKLAQAVKTDESYLSKLFKKETGLTLSAYIRKRKIEYAQSMLKYGGYNYSEIAEYLAFSSQSHFIDIFRKETGFTPKEYRNQYYRRSW